MKAGHERLAANSVKDATCHAAEQLKWDAAELKQLFGELSLELHLLKTTEAPAVGRQPAHVT
jgi:hypothetical protein